MVNCTWAVDAPKTRAISGSDGRYISVVNGPNAVSAASSAVSAKVLGRSMRDVRRVSVPQHAAGRTVIHEAVAMQVRAMRIEPCFGARDVRTNTIDQPPETPRMIHLDQMRDFMRCEIVEHERWRENKPPRIGQDAGGRARAPAAGLTADRHTLDFYTELSGGAAAGGFQISFGFALEKIGDAARHMRLLTGDAKQILAGRVTFNPYRAARARPVHDPMIDAAQRQSCAIGERGRLRQAAEPSRDPGTLLLRKVARLFQAPARRHRKQHFARGRMDTQCVAPRPPVTAHAHRIDRLVEGDVDRQRLARPAIKQSA